MSTSGRLIRRHEAEEVRPSKETDAMTITITAFERSPDGGKGLARDTRVRWALEEVGQPYEVRLVSFAEMKAPDHLAIHPFRPDPHLSGRFSLAVRDRLDRLSSC
jgi:hypothetical protein